MPFELNLPKKLRNEGWKVKIFDKERIEPPHLTIMHKQDRWRLGLRDEQLLIPPGGRINDIDPRVMERITENWGVLISNWDNMYPSNPVSSRVEDE